MSNLWGGHRLRFMVHFSQPEAAESNGGTKKAKKSKTESPLSLPLRPVTNAHPLKYIATVGLFFTAQAPLGREESLMHRHKLMNRSRHVFSLHVWQIVIFHLPSLSRSMRQERKRWLPLLVEYFHLVACTRGFLMRGNDVLIHSMNSAIWEELRCCILCSFCLLRW